MINVEAAGTSDIGKVRKANEDSWFLSESMGLYVVADGMGGHRGGAVASQLAVKTMGDYMPAACRQASSLDANNAENFQNEAVKRLLHSIALANKKIHALSLVDESCRGMGTTVSALFLRGDFMITANVGDSPIYLVRKGEIKDLYTPHTLLHERNKIPKSLEGRFTPGKMAHVLTRAVGIRQRVRIDHIASPLFSGDVIVLCSDGLSGKVSREEIRALVNKNDAKAACEMLTDLALQRGGQDNITVIVVKNLSASGKSSKSGLDRLFTFPAWLGSCCKRKPFPNQS